MILDICIALPILFGVYKGYKSGILKVMVMTISFFIGITISFKYISELSLFLRELTQWESTFIPIVSFLLAFAIIILFGVIIVKVLEMVLKLILLNWVNKIIGAVFGGLLSFIVVATLFWLINSFQVLPEGLKAESILIPYVSDLAPVLYSYLPFVKEYLKDAEQLFETYSN